MKLIFKIIKVTLAMGGILIDKFNPQRVLLITIIILGYIFHYFLNNILNLELAIAYFVTIFIIRYLFLFQSFIKNGISDGLISKFGEKRGYEIYQFVTALMFFFGAASYSLLVTKSAGYLFLVIGPVKPFFLSMGIIVFSIGIIVNTWSAILVGIDIYYYKDLFLRKPVSEFKKEGPYLIFSNPMYGIGQASGYGTAIMYGSVAGLIAIFLNQAMMYIFYLTIEKPHIQRLFGKELTINKA